MLESDELKLSYKYESIMADQMKQRHGFTTFWLCLTIVANAIEAFFGGVLGAFVAGDVYFSPSATDNSLFIMTIIMGVGKILACALCIWGVALLFKWKRKGFTICLLSTGLFFVMECLFAGMMHDFSLVILPLIGAGVMLGSLYGFLHLRRNGKSCWSQLE